jgi:hypothetical protein
MHKVFLSLGIFFFCCFFGTGGNAAEFTGDLKLACETVLCFSSPNRPGECSPAINKYFSIIGKNAVQTAVKRQQFLNLCPFVAENPAMQSLVSTISNAAGMCDAAQLNAIGQWITQSETLPGPACKGKVSLNLPNIQETWILSCPDDSQLIENARCQHDLRFWLVNTLPPQYCKDLWDHQYTNYDKKPHIVTGANPWDTMWHD